MRYLITLLLSTCLFAQANQVFTINPSVYSSGMGNTGMAHGNIQNLFHNPALITLDTNYAELTNVTWLPDLASDMSYQNLMYTSDKGFGVELFYFNYGTQVEADASGIVLGDFDASSFRLGATYGGYIKDWHLGGRFNIYSHDFLDSIDIGNSYGFDLGAYREWMVNDTNYMALGIVLKDLGTKNSFVDTELELPASLGLGFKYTTGNGFTIATDTKLYQDYYSLGFGTEYSYQELFDIRAGYYTEPDYEVDYFTIGAGVQAKGIGLDITFLLNPDSFHNKTFMLSLGFEI
tara:strand:+ start:432 stop:1304 length:873 start_codon:yes stop_codon:yes gene_type:complete